MNSDYIPVEIVIPKEYYVKTTEKSLCFKLWGKKPLVVPRKFIKNLEETAISFALLMPAWFIAKNGLRGFIEDIQLRDRLFPTKTMVKQREQLERERPLLKEKDESELIPSTRMIEPVEKTKEAKPIQGVIPF